jgi:transposase
MDNATVARLLGAANVNEQITILLQQDYTYEGIIQVLHVSSKTISIIKDAIIKGEPIPAMGNRGQPTKKTSEIITITIEETVNNPRLSASALQLIIQTKTGISISVPKILEIRKDSGYYYSPLKYMSNLTDLNKKEFLSVIRS